MVKELDIYQNNFKINEHIPSILKFGKVKSRTPKFSIVIPTYRRPELLKKSLKSAIGQVNFKDYEIIVVDNEFFPSDKMSATESIVRSFNADKLLYYQNSENLGMTGNWNRGIELAHGEYITILHDDDWLEPEFLEIASKKVNGNKLIITKANICDYRKNRPQKHWMNIKNFLRKIIDTISKDTTISIKDFYLRNPSYGTLGLIFRREELIKLGGYNSQMYPVMDYWLHVQYCDKYGAILCKRRLCNYRIAENESFKIADLWAKKLFSCRKQMIKTRSDKLGSWAQYIFELYIYDIRNNNRMWQTGKKFTQLRKQHAIRYIVFALYIKCYILFCQ